MKVAAIAEKIIRPFAGSKLTLWLFALLVVFLVPSTFFPAQASWFLLPVKGILILLGLNLAVCTIRRFRALRPSTLAIHLGTFVILTGGLISASGYIATVNIYEGASVDKVFRWDKGEDVNLGIELRVAGLHLDLYPVPVKVGIMKKGRKARLVTTMTGESFDFDGYAIKPLSINPLAKDMQVEVRDTGGKLIGTVTTGGQGDLPPDFPLDFKLVAFQDPVVKRMWVDLELRKGDKVVATGTSEVNGPLKWHGMQFFLTSVAADENGIPYAGIQISKDPGLPVVYFGAIIICFGLLLGLKRWRPAKGKAASLK